MMWFSRAIRWDRAAVNASAVATASACWVAAASSPIKRQSFHQHNHTLCEGTSSSSSSSPTMDKDRLRKRATTVQQASARGVMVLNRTNTRQELSKLRSHQEEMLQRWERDEDGWRELPARAWPEYQPNPEQLKGIQEQVAQHECKTSSSLPELTESICQSLLFNVATALVFYSIDPKRGFEQYMELAQKGHVDSMVACGIILVESGLGGGGESLRNREDEGILWLELAVSLGSTQAAYELGTVYYTGIDGILEEDSEKAFSLFEKAAAEGHVGAMYMMADCLMEGEGTRVDVARAVPLLYKAADQGHRYARQRVRELLKDKTYQI